ncbi:hypothetical protein BDV96DRAFT_235423 [Lophiotrema nucula]|uniref:Uncharacterized protein n=1 Tax=Lophiotrema nucula TaxID=690887 RepID=A0A6A5YRP3_9PLEO|nr:hypothetical protein BDV96DRAFT_235423 [Lophiotrema nucula]
MAETPLSPPTISTTASAPSASDQPISPVHRTGTFPHKTSSAAAVHPFIETSTKPINEFPVEIDGVPASPKDVKRRGAGDIVSPGLGEEAEIEEEFLGDGERGVGKEVWEKRKQLLASRSQDPAVVVDIPQEPTAEEVEAAKSAEGTVTPGLPAKEFEISSKR